MGGGREGGEVAVLGGRGDAWYGLQITLKSSWVTASTMGTISAVVAVLEIHMDRNAVVSIIPSINLQPIRWEGGDGESQT